MAVGGGDQLRHLRRQETLQPADALDLGELLFDPLLQRPVPVLQLVGLLLQFCRLLLHGGMRGREFAALLVDFGEQPRIAHRQHRLMRKGLHQPDQIGRELAGALPQHHQRAQNALSGRPAAPPAPNGNRRSTATSRSRWSAALARSGIAIGSPLAAAWPSTLPSWSMTRWLAFGRLVDADRFGEVELLFCRVIAVDQHGVGMGDFQRARRHRRQHGVEIERGGDRAADFLEHLELVDRLRQVPGALLDLGFETGIGFLQLARPCC